MRKMNRKAMLLCCAAVPALAVTAAFAQDTDDPDEDVLVVTGIRKAIEDSLDTKRDSNSIVEAISAEDIGKLPDVSIADSLARLPGVTAQRVRGRAQQISIRGLGPDFSIALLNGREQVSAGNNRGIEFDQFPSELIASALVYKTPDATLAATGIAGAVDLRTVRPLDYSGRRLNVSGRYVVNDQDELNPDFENDGYRLFGSYIDQFADGTVGVSLGMTVQSNPTQFLSRELKTNQFQVARDPATGLIYPADNPRFGAVSRDFERTSVSGSLQWEPSDRFETVVDVYYTDTEDAGIFRGVETPIASWSGAEFQNTTGSGPFAETASFGAVVPIVRTDTEGNTAEITSVGWNTEWQATDRISFMLDLSRSELDRSDIDYESYAGTGPGRSGPQDNLTFNLRPDGDFQAFHQIDYTDPDTVFLTDPGGWGQVGFIKEPKIDDELNQLRLEADYALENLPFSNIKVGYLRTDREKTFDSNEAFLRQSSAFGMDGNYRIPDQFVVGATDTGSLSFDILAYDPSSFLTDGTYDVEKATFDTEWSVEEDINTFYAMLDIDSMFAERPLRGNIGFQYIETEQASTGTLAGAGEQTVEYDYDDFLPSLNLAWEVGEDTFLRFAAARTLTRARLDQLAANQNISFNPLSCADTTTDGLPDTLIAFNPPNVVCFSLGGGNPTLEPYRSNSYDISFEQYFSGASAFAFAIFHKELEDWVQSTSTFVDGSQQIRAFGAGAFLDANPEVAQTNLGGPVNVAEGSITGFEATLRMSLGDFSEALDGFGFNASYTYADSSLDFEGNDITIPGYSENIWSGDVYYEKFGWRARLSARSRGEFLSEVQQFDGTLFGAEAQDETILDAQVGYRFDQGPLEGLSLLVEAYNITDEPFVTQNELFGTGGDVIGTFPSRYESYGTTYNFTVAYEF